MRNRIQPSRPHSNGGDAISSYLILLALLGVAALGFGLLSFALTVINGVNTPPSDLSIQRLAIYADTRQSVAPSAAWTDIVYDHNRYSSPRWAHTPGTTPVTCLYTNVYTVYVSLQTRVVAPPGPPVPANLSECHACALWLELRGVLQIGGVGAFNEVSTSLVFQRPSGGQRAINTQFLIVAAAGDVLKLQFRSACPYLFLANVTYKGGGSNSSIVNTNDTLSSSTLLIY